MVSKKLTMELGSITRRIPTIKFIPVSQAIILLLILFSFLVPTGWQFIIHNLLSGAVSLTIILSILIFVQSDYSVDKIGLIAGLLILSSLTLTVLQVEWWIVHGKFEITIILLLITTIISASVGIYLIYRKLGVLSRKSIFMLTWLFSLFMILYFPLEFEYFPYVSRGRVNIIILFIAISVSTISSILLTINLSMRRDHMKLLDAGDMRRILGDAKGAELYYEKALDVGFETGEIHTRLGDIFFTKGDHERALSHYNKSIAYLKDRNYRLAAVSSSAMGLYADSIKLIRQGLLVKTSPPNWYILGRMFKQTGDKELELDCYREALALDGTFWPAYAGLADSAEDAQDLFQIALEKRGYHISKRELLKKLEAAGRFAPLFIHPADLDLWESEGSEIRNDVVRILLEYIVGSLEISDPASWQAANEALSDLDDVHDFLADTRSPDGMILRNIFLGSVGDDLEERGLRALKNTGQQDMAYYILGLFKGIRGELEKALRYFDMVESIHLRPRAYAAKGCIYYLKNNPSEARRNWRTAMSLGYTQDDLSESMSRLARELGETEQSYYFSRTVSSFPEIVLSDEDDEHIIEQIRKATINNDYRFTDISASDHPLLMGTVRFMKGDYSRAEEHFNRILEKDNDDADGHLGRGMCLLGKRRFEDALEELEIAIELNGSDSIYYFYRGIANFRSGNKEKALADFNHVYIDNPGWERNNHYISVCIGSKN
ncbi:MAG: tetratricopeptide repeat protein [Thermoplasmata archaeon]